MSGYLGKSDVQMNGTISNYMGYMFAENQPLRGTMTLNSNKFDVNEWMVDEFTGEPVPAITAGRSNWRGGSARQPGFRTECCGTGSDFTIT